MCEAVNPLGTFAGGAVALIVKKHCANRNFAQDKTRSRTRHLSCGSAAELRESTTQSAQLLLNVLLGCECAKSHHQRVEIAKATATKAAAKKSSPATAAAAKKDATILLQRDHTEAHKLFKRYEKLARAEAPASERKALAEQVCKLVTVHAQIEEEIFYPAAREANVEEDLMDEADVEHASAKDLIAQIKAMEPDDDHYDAKLKVLGEYIDHHVEEEEEQMFPKCRKAKMDLATLASQLAERKSVLLSQE